MIVAFLNSIKYTGYLFPLAFARIVFGYIFIQTAIYRVTHKFLEHPELAAAITDWLPNSSAPLWYAHTLESIVVPNWKILAYGVIYCEFLIGFSFLLGFLVRPVSLLGVFYSIHFIFSHPQPSEELYGMYLLFFVLTLWMGAGRCLGMDYFFYKRQHGILW